VVRKNITPPIRTDLRHSRLKAILVVKAAENWLGDDALAVANVRRHKGL
jgi:hypothetical protein